MQRVANCPYQAWKIEQDGIKEQGILLDIGKVLHKLGEDKIKEAIKNQWQPEDLADEIINELPSVRPDIQPRVIKAARFFAIQILQLRIWDILGVEMQVDDACKTGIQARDGTPFILTACLDLFISGRANSAHIWDFKSGFKKRNKEETFNDFQAQFDSNIIFKMFDGSNGTDRIERIHWWFLETFWGTRSYACFERSAEVPSLPHLDLEKQIEGRIFKAITLWVEGCREAWPEEKKCAWCPIVMDCPHAIAGVKRIAKDPKSFIDRMIALKASYDKHAEIAKYWLQEYGAIKGTGMVYDFRPKKHKFTPKLYKRQDNGKG